MGRHYFTRFVMDDYEDRTTIMDAIETMYYSGGTTNTAESLSKMSSELFQGSGARRGININTIMNVHSLRFDL